jgi:hypothetical protein
VNYQLLNFTVTNLLEALLVLVALSLESKLGGKDVAELGAVT